MCVHTQHCDVTFAHVIRSHCNSAAPHPPDKMALSALRSCSVDVDSSVKVADIIRSAVLRKKQQKTVLDTDTVLLSSVPAAVEDLECSQHR